MLAAFIIGVLQAIFPFVPFMVLAGLNGVRFGWGLGVCITFSSAMCGALISFWLARNWGRDWAQKRFGAKYGEQIETFSSFYGFKAVLAARFIPVVPSTLINILAGVSKIGYKQFVLASALGIFPFSFLYTIGGQQLVKLKNNELILFLFALILASLWYYSKYYRKQKGLS